MKKIICILVCLIFTAEWSLAAEISRLYLLEKAQPQALKYQINPIFNKLGYNLIKDGDYLIYENPAKSVFNVIVFKQNGNDCYYYYLSNEGQDLNKTALETFDSYNYEYKRIKNSAFLDLFYNDTTNFLTNSKSSIKTVSDHNLGIQTSEKSTNEYDFSDEAQERFNQGQVSPQQTQQQLTITPSNVLVGSLLHLEAGSGFNAVLSSGISSESISNNDRISAQLMQDWTFNGIVIAPAGSLVNGNVIDSDVKSLIGGAAVGGAFGTMSALGTKGEDIDVPEGTNLQIMLSEPMTVQPYLSL